MTRGLKILTFQASALVSCALVMATVADVASAVAAAGPSEGNPRPVNISLTSFALTPGTLYLKAGQPILLRVANDSGLSHDLTAPEFFSAAAIRPADAARITDGKIALSPHHSLIIAMIPAAGRFSVKCSHKFHKMLGMSGLIVVDS